MADARYRGISKNDSCPSDKACDALVRGGHASQVEEILRLVARDSDFVDAQCFATIHKIVLGLSFKDLQDEIVRDPDSIDVTDAGGRTALTWAAARGDEDTVALLLSYNADPDIMDNKTYTPLKLAAIQHHAGCVELLLMAGAEPDPVMPQGTSIGSPLNCAARYAPNPLTLSHLLRFGAETESSGVDRVTPLLHCARGKPPSFTKLLLEHNADLNATSKTGQTPLTLSIIHNNPWSPATTAG